MFLVRLRLRAVTAIRLSGALKHDAGKLTQGVFFQTARRVTGQSMSTGVQLPVPKPPVLSVSCLTVVTTTHGRNKEMRGFLLRAKQFVY